MGERRWTMYIPVLVVLLVSVPIVYVAQWNDFVEVRERADEVVESSGFFSGFSEDTSTTVDVVPDNVIDRTLPDSDENVTVKTNTGEEENVTQPTPKKTVYKGLVTAGVMIGIAIASAFGIFMLFKLKKRITLKLFFTFALWTCSSVAMMLYLYLTRDFLKGVIGLHLGGGGVFYAVIIGIGAAVGTMIVFNMVYRSLEPRKKNPALIAFCVLLGPFLAIVLPIWVVVFLVAGVAVWDLWAAKRGIIKEMVNLSDEHRKEERARDVEYRIPPSPSEVKPMMPAQAMADPSPVGMSRTTSKRSGARRRKLIEVRAGEDITSYGLYEGKHYSLGIGDFIFFSLLASTAFKWMMLKLPWMGYYEPVFGEVLAVAATVLVMVMILVGLKQTLGYLDKEAVMPGLPLSVLWGLLTLVMVSLFLEVVNLIFYGTMVHPF